MFLPRTLAAIALASIASAQIAKYCPQDGGGKLCYSVSLPDTTVSSGSGDVYFQIQGPAAMQWIALGQGNAMAGANIFVVYANAAGTNVTISPRDGKGNFQPKFDSVAAQPYLLDGSGIANGIMTANVRCSSCIKWQASTLDVTSTKSQWIWAAKGGSSLRSNDQAANLQQHNNFGEFTLDLTKAKSGNSPNPFADNKAATTTATAATSPVSSGGSSSNDSGAASASSSSSSESDSDSSESNIDKIVTAHGVIMSFAWVIVFPLGAILIRALSTASVVRIHYLTQIFAYILALTGMALGIYIAVKPDSVIEVYHPVIGLVVMGLATIQPILGTLHHRIYKSKGKTTWWATAHVWLGRAVITLAMINGGLGLRLSDNSKKGEIAYGVIAGLVWLGWMGVAVMHEARKAKQGRGSGGQQSGSAEKIYAGRDGVNNGSA